MTYGLLSETSCIWYNKADKLSTIFSKKVLIVLNMFHVEHFIPLACLFTSRWFTLKLTLWSRIVLVIVFFLCRLCVACCVLHCRVLGTVCVQTFKKRRKSVVDFLFVVKTRANYTLLIKVRCRDCYVLRFNFVVLAVFFWNAVAFFV